MSSFNRSILRAGQFSSLDTLPRSSRPWLKHSGACSLLVTVPSSRETFPLSQNPTRMASSLNRPFPLASFPPVSVRLFCSFSITIIDRPLEVPVLKLSVFTRLRKRTEPYEGRYQGLTVSLPFVARFLEGAWFAFRFRSASKLLC